MDTSSHNAGEMDKNTPAAPEAPAPDSVSSFPQTPSRRRFILGVFLLAAICASAYYGYHYFTVGRFLVATDDAYVKANITIIAAKVPGYIVKLNVIDNQLVQANEVLAQIDPEDYRIAVEAASRKIKTQEATIARIGAQATAQEALIAQSRAQKTAVEADHVRAVAEFERASSLVDKNIGTQQRLDLARAERDRSTASLLGADAAINAAIASLGVLQAQKREAEQVRAELNSALDRAQRDLEATTIKAPVAGIIGNKAAQLGMYAQPGARLMALIAADSSYVEANFKETQVGRIAPGQKVSIDVDAYPEHRIIGEVESLAPATGAEYSLLPPENATGNFTKIVQRLPVRIRLPQRGEMNTPLNIGLSVVVTIDTRSRQNEAAKSSGAVSNEILRQPGEGVATTNEAGAH